MLLSGSLAALSLLLIGGAAWFALQSSPEGEEVVAVPPKAVEYSALTAKPDEGLGTSLASKTMSALKNPHAEKKEAARLAILNHSDGPLEVLELREVEELTGIAAPRRPAPAPAATQSTTVAAATQIRRVQPAQTQAASTRSVIDVTAPRETVEEEVQLAASVEKTCVGELRTLAKRSTIYFGSGSSQLDANGLNILRTIGSAAAACPEVIVQVTGHSDSSGSDAANLALSWQRADNTLAALSALGIETSRFEAVGFGARAPSSQGDSADPDFDRRVEFQILDAN